MLKTNKTTVLELQILRMGIGLWTSKTRNVGLNQATKSRPPWEKSEGADKLAQKSILRVPYHATFIKVNPENRLTAHLSLALNFT